MYTCMYMRSYRYLYICVYVYVCEKVWESRNWKSDVCVYKYLRSYTNYVNVTGDCECANVFIHVCLHVFMFTCIYVYMYLWVSMCECVNMYEYTCVYMYV